MSCNSPTRAGEAIDLKSIQVFTQKGLYTRKIMEEMGLGGLNREIGELKESGRIPDRRLGQELRQRRDWLREQVRDYVEKQFLLHADATGKRLREDLLRRVKLSNVEHRSFRLIQEIVYKMAKKLAALHSRRKKVFKRGQLNVPRTLRHNMSYDGAIFDLRWKSVKVDRPKVFAICDVSGSVANYARFMLMFLYSLEEVMPKVRSFAFSSDLAEVTDLFERNKIEDAIAKTYAKKGEKIVQMKGQHDALLSAGVQRKYGFVQQVRQHEEKRLNRKERRSQQSSNHPTAAS